MGGNGQHEDPLLIGSNLARILNTPLSIFIPDAFQYPATRAKSTHRYLLRQSHFGAGRQRRDFCDPCRGYLS